MKANDYKNDVVIDVRGIRRTYGAGSRSGYGAVRGVGLHVRRGEVFALLGTDGAGKTSTVELVEGLAPADGGRVRVLGRDPYRRRAEVRPLTGVMFDLPAGPRPETLSPLPGTTHRRTDGQSVVLHTQDLQTVLTRPLSRAAEQRTGLERLDARTASPEEALLATGTTGGGPAGPRERLTPLDGCRTMILTGHSRPGRLKRAWEAGVRGFLPKAVSAHGLANIIRAVHAGRRRIASELAAGAIGYGDCSLTPRKTDVLSLAADGASIAETAEQMGLSAGTVRNHISSVVSKSGADNRHAAARTAKQHGWI